MAYLWGAYLGLAALVLATPSTAGETRTPGASVDPFAAPLIAQQPPAAPAESAAAEPRFYIVPSLTVSEGYSDNIFATRNDQKGDLITVVVPELTFGIDGDVYDLEVFGVGELGRYRHSSGEDYEDYALGAEGRYLFSPRNAVFGGLSFAHDHEPRVSPDDVNGVEPTIYSSTQAFVGTYNRFERITTRVGGTFEELDFDDVAAGSGTTIDNDDRDRDLITAGARLGYVIDPTYEVFVQGSYDLRDYRTFTDGGLTDRDSDGFSGAIGLAFRRDQAYRAEAFIGFLNQDYDDPNLEDIDTPDFGLDVEWEPDAATRFSAFLDRTIQETTLFGASGYVRTAFGLGLEKDIRPDLEIHTRGIYAINDYRGSGREDEVLDLSAGTRYSLTPYVFAGLDYSFQQRSSSDPDEDYDENQIFFRLGAQWLPEAAAARRVAGPDADFGTGGLYFGGQAAVGNLGTELEGPRGGGGTLTADFADHGLGGGVFGGYGQRIGDWYLGLELDAELSESQWTHVRAPGGREFSVDKGNSYGAGALFGYVLPEGQMLYGRFGGVLTEFDTDYVESGVATPQDDTLRGLRVGGGVEVPIDGGAFLRLDYTYTTYEDYDVDFNGPGEDNFANNESMLRAGIGYRFNAPDRPSPAPDADRFDGAYVGLQGGYGAFNTDLFGDRPADTLDAQFGDEGATGGVFAGYGLTFGSFYLGGELEVEVSNVTGDHQRDPSGRDFAVDKRYGYGASARAGMVFGGSTLVYARAGVVETEFSTDFSTSGASASRDDSETGLRLGGGVELQVTDDVFMRADYTYTDYDEYALVVGGSSERFDNSESLLRLGLGFRF